MEIANRAAVRTRKEKRSPASDGRVAVFTSLDGTLLDMRTFKAGANRTRIRQLMADGVSVIPVSVMTLEEIAPIAAELGLREAMIIEAGGAIARWKAGAWEVEPCGPTAETLLEVVARIEDRSGANLLVYSAMDAAAAMAVSGRSGDMLQASSRRCFSEPFVVESGNLAAVERAANELGFSVRRDRRLLHLCRSCDEGAAFLRLRKELRCDITIAIGGSLVDVGFMTRTDIAMIVPGQDGTLDPELMRRLPNAHVAPAPAPEGWAMAVDKALRLVAAPKKRARITTS